MKPTRRKTRLFAKASIHFAKFLFLLFLLLALGSAALQEILVSLSERNLPVFSIFFLIASISLLEYGIHRSLPQYYFRIGIPVMWREYTIDFAKGLPTDFARISGKVEPAGLLPQVEIKQLTPVEYGLWANAMQSGKYGWPRRKRRYHPLTRGYIYLDKENIKLKMRVYLNWGATALILFWFSMIIFSPGLLLKIIFMLIGIALLIMLYQGETQQYLKVWDVVKRYTYGEYGADEIANRLTK